MKNNLLENLINNMSIDITKKYKISEEACNSFLLQEINKNKLLLDLLKEDKTLKQILKTKIFKDFNSKTKKAVYHNLRTYHKKEINQDMFNKKYENDKKQQEFIENLINSHISTKERALEKDYYNEIFNLISAPNSILDLGCGINPIMFNRDYPHVNATIVGIDKDKSSIALINKYASWTKNKNVTAFEWKIEDGFNSLEEKTEITVYDFCLVMKVVPVALRHNTDAWKILSEIPAKYILFTASKSSMTKNKSIEHRENKTLLNFLRKTDYEVIHTFNKNQEFGYLVKTKNA